jgi:hypothetical protein
VAAGCTSTLPTKAAAATATTPPIKARPRSLRQALGNDDWEPVGRVDGALTGYSGLVVAGTPGWSAKLQ